MHTVTVKPTAPPAPPDKDVLNPKEACWNLPNQANVSYVANNPGDIQKKPSHSMDNLGNCIFKAIIGIGLLYFRILPQNIRYPLAAISIGLAIRDGINFGRPSIHQTAIPVGVPVAYPKHSPNVDRFRQEVKVVPTRDWLSITNILLSFVNLAAIVSSNHNPSRDRRPRRNYQPRYRVALPYFDHTSGGGATARRRPFSPPRDGDQPGNLYNNTRRRWPDGAFGSSGGGGATFRRPPSLPRSPERW